MDMRLRSVWTSTSAMVVVPASSAGGIRATSVGVSTTGATATVFTGARA